jgi:hypothetical protein
MIKIVRHTRLLAVVIALGCIDTRQPVEPVNTLGSAASRSGTIHLNGSASYTMIS